MIPKTWYMNKITFKCISIVILVAFIGTSIKTPAYAQMAQDPMPRMTAPGVMVHLSPEFTPAFLKGIVIHPENALKFDFIINKGDKALTDAQKREEYTRLTKYFLASLAIPDDDQWVNLSPYEKDRIIKEDFGKTEMGRDLLAQDYLLKQITASLVYPQDKLGREFWDRIYSRAQEQFGTSNIPVNTFNKVWIVPDDALVYEKGNMAYVVKNHLKVMLEEDYLSLAKHSGIESVGAAMSSNKAHALASKVVREIVLPALEQEVNEGKNFAPLRQVFSGMVLAAWYKRALKESLLGKIYMNKSRVKGVDQDPRNNEIIYKQYLKAFKKGVFNFIQEDVDKYTNQTIPRKYFSGGIQDIYNRKGHPSLNVERAMTASEADEAQAAVFNMDMAAIVAEEHDAVKMTRRHMLARSGAIAATLALSPLVSGKASAQQVIDLSAGVNYGYMSYFEFDDEKDIERMINIYKSSSIHREFQDEILFHSLSKLTQGTPYTPYTISKGMTYSIQYKKDERFINLLQLTPIRFYHGTSYFNGNSHQATFYVVFENLNFDPKKVKKDDFNLHKFYIFNFPHAADAAMSISENKAEASAAMTSNTVSVLSFPMDIHDGYYFEFFFTEAHNFMVNLFNDYGGENARKELEAKEIVRSINKEEELQLETLRQIQLDMGSLYIHWDQYQIAKGKNGLSNFEGLSLLNSTMKSLQQGISGAMTMISTRERVYAQIFKDSPKRNDEYLSLRNAIEYVYKFLIYNMNYNALLKIYGAEALPKSKITNGKVDRFLVLIMNKRYFEPRERGEVQNALMVLRGQLKVLAEFVFTLDPESEVNKNTDLAKIWNKLTPYYYEGRPFQPSVSRVVEPPNVKKLPNMVDDVKLRLSLLLLIRTPKVFQNDEDYQSDSLESMSIGSEPNINNKRTRLIEFIKETKKRKYAEDYLRDLDVLLKDLGDKAQIVNQPDYGGIDFNAANLNLQIKRDGKGVPLPISQQNLENIHIDGLIPVILDIKPAMASSLLSELQGNSP